MNRGKRIKIYRRNLSIPLPQRMTDYATGLDIYVEKRTKLPLNTVVLIETGLILQVPQNYHIKLFIRSSIAVKYQIALINSVGIIDADYCGENDFLKIPVIRFSNGMNNDNLFIEKGDRIGQIVFERTEFPCIYWEEQKYPNFAGKSRGGFGSTGKS